MTIGEKRHTELKAAIEKRLEQEDLKLKMNDERAIVTDLDGFTIDEWESLSDLYVWIRDGGLEKLEEDERPELENL